LDGLAKYAELGNKNRAQLITIGIVTSLLDLCLSEDKLIKKAAVGCLATITEISTSN
jgi:hypothetical protein